MEFINTQNVQIWQTNNNAQSWQTNKNEVLEYRQEYRQEDRQENEIDDKQADSQEIGNIEISDEECEKQILEMIENFDATDIMAKIMESLAQLPPEQRELFSASISEVLSLPNKIQDLCQEEEEEEQKEEDNCV